MIDGSVMGRGRGAWNSDADPVGVTFVAGAPDGSYPRLNPREPAALGLSQLTAQQRC